MSLLSINNGEETSCIQAECHIGGSDKTIPGLPNEIMGLIFSFLTESPWTLYVCTLVNKECYDLANPMLWKAPDFFDRNQARRFRDGMLALSDARRHTLGLLIHDLRLTELTWSKKDYPRLLPHMAHLQHLTLANCKNDKVIQKLPALRSLQLDNVGVTEANFDTLAQWPLEALDWTLKSAQSPLWLNRLAGCPLRRLTLDCSMARVHIDPSTFDRLLQERRPAWEIARLMTTPFSTFLADPSTFPHLTYLRICLCTEVHDAMLVDFFKHHPHLEELHLSMQPTVTDAALVAVHLPRLKRASLTYMQHISAPAVRRFIRACPSLTYMDISGCRQIKESDFPELGWERLGVLKPCVLAEIKQSKD